jgi:ferric-dicitrate binding protein FerR (iron transport regulator)
MTKEAFKTILNKYIEGNASPLETAYVEKWYAQVEELNNFEGRDIDALGDDIYNRIHKQIKKRKSKPVVAFRWLFRVAAVLLLILAGALIYQYILPTRPHNVAGSIVPGTEKALLKLDDGTVIELDSTGAGNVASEGGSEIVKLKDGTIAYNSISANQEVKFNEVSIPAGGSYKLRLPDGTMVWLNAVSSIRFPTRFTGPERKVIVKGETYFEVTHNKNQPFIVEVPGRQQISVLGTHFNVNAYDDEATVKTTLLQGSVKVQTPLSGKNVILRPGQQTVVRAGRAIETISGIDVGKVMAWKNGYFDFDQTEISEIMRQVSRWYNASIELDPRLKGLTFSGRIPRTENVQKLLKMFEATSTVTYRVAGNQIKIYQKR